MKKITITHHKGLLSCIVFLFLFTISINAQVSGIVFRDVPLNGTTLNVYGEKDVNEVGVEDVSVLVTDVTGATFGTTTTPGTGAWSVTGATLPVRVEFSWTQTGLKPSPDGAHSNTTVQFVTAASTSVDLGVHVPKEYNTELDPWVFTSVYSAGDPLPGGSASGMLKSIVGTHYNTTGTSSGDRYTAATAVTNGTTWGMAMDNEKKLLFNSAVARRYAGFGPQGPAGLYVFDASNPAALVLDNSFDLSGLLPTTADPRISDALPTNPSASDTDPVMFDLIGRMSFGGLDVSDDGKTLWIVNMTDRKLYSIDISNYPTLGAVTAYDTGLDPGCSNGDYVPWAVKEYAGDVYVGVVCTGETSTARTDLDAFVMKLTSSGFATEYQFDIDYTRGSTLFSNPAPANQWNTWVDDFNDYGVSRPGFPQPILSSIEFDADGSLYLGFIDRTGLQGGRLNSRPDGSSLYQADGGGDLMKVCRIGGNYVLEGSGGCTTAGVANGQGPNGGEFFFEDNFGTNHHETALGGLAHLQGSGNVLSMVFDPFDSHSGGFGRMNTSTGAKVGAYRINGFQETGTFGKAGGLGDIEVINETAPVEIGNLVWEDTDGDGIQDPGEPGISGVTVQLIKSGAVIATASTDSNGNYIFSNDPSAITTLSHIYGINMLMDDMDYTVRIPLASGATKQAVLGANELSPSNVGEGVVTDINDSDGVASSIEADAADAPVVASDIPFSGANNHRFDFGFGGPGCPPARCGPISGVKN